MVQYMDYTSPSAQFMFDLNTSPLFVKNQENYINVMGISQLNTLDNLSLLDIFMSKDHIVEPHYHQNAAELVYCISGAAGINILNPFTNQIIHHTITPGQTVNVPQGWWHYETAEADHTHLIAIFNAPEPQVILGSNLLIFTPPNIMAYTYCFDPQHWNQLVSSVQPNTYIGPCQPRSRRSAYQRRPSRYR